ncbi:MAG: membrane dipeptidase [Chloroflexi bacterium]|nr:membrane dipeptidase [Chloroflexota bacterium]
MTLHYESIIFDGHCDTLLEVLDGKRRLNERSTEGHIDLPRLREGGVTAQVFAIFIEDKYLPAKAAKQTLRLLDVLYTELAANTDSLVLATRAEDIERAKQTGKVAAVVGIEGAESLEGELGLLRIFHRLGVRLLTIAWSRRNEAADGIQEARTGGGLTNFGLKLVEECNRLGIMVDISHLAPAGVRDVLETSSKPVIASHSNAYALCPHPRNLTDQQLTALAEKGGVVGVTFVPSFIAEDRKEASLEKLLDHIDHIVRVAGIDHVGLGSDFDGFSPPPPAGLEDVTRLPGITAGLLSRGYSADEVRKILGGNFLRVFRQVAG